MADVKERISIEGNFKEQVQAFVDGLIKSRLELKKLVMNTVSGTKNINSSMSLSVKAINKFASEFIKQGDTVEQAIKKATDNKINIQILEKDNKYNITNTPALIINDKLISQGKVLNEREIKKFIEVLA